MSQQVKYQGKNDFQVIKREKVESILTKEKTKNLKMFFICPYLRTGIVLQVFRHEAQLSGVMIIRQEGH